MITQDDIEAFTPDLEEFNKWRSKAMMREQRILHIIELIYERKNTYPDRSEIWQVLDNLQKEVTQS